jgi:hypothetical protein
VRAQINTDDAGGVPGNAHNLKAIAITLGNTPARCAGCGTQGCVCPPTRRRGGAYTAAAVTGWELEVAGLVLYLVYDWDEVTGDGDLRMAVE